MKPQRIAPVLPFIVVLFTPIAALAVDGVDLINQSRANAGNVTPGDTAGFPVTITRSGSYRLSGNLTVPNANTTAIEIVASNVSIDLNGFAIIGPVVCSGDPLVCTPSAGTGFGISTAAPFVNFINTTVRNGSVRGMGRAGISLRGNGGHLVENVHATSNGSGGIGVNNGVVTHCTALQNGLSGIEASGTVSYSVARGNRIGISVGRGLALYNTSLDNDLAGLSLGSAAGYLGNALSSNNPNVDGIGNSLGQNICGNDPCP